MTNEHIKMAAEFVLCYGITVIGCAAVRVSISMLLAALIAGAAVILINL